MPSLSRARLWRKPWGCRTCRALSSSTEKQAPERKAWQKLPSTPARTRFAPSPTGYLHLGSLRTALFNYLLARATGGQFILRVEDTDKKRTIHDSEQRLYEDLRWAGLEWDEGPSNGGPYGPYRQSERTALYTDHAQKLLQSGHAYRCFCSPERLNKLAKQRNQLGLSSDYDRTCAGVPKEESDERTSKGEAHVIRLKAPATPPEYFDLIYGSVGKSKNKKSPLNRGEPRYDDSILIKSDGLPTYHLANVVDDHYMRITHVIRASEWMTSTPKHLVMYKAFGWEPPQFAHVGLLQDDKRQKFSKRNADLDIRAFERDGIFPEALVSYVALHGWSHTLGNDFLSLQDLVRNFDLKFTKGNTMVQPAKLKYLQKKYAQKYIDEDCAKFESMIDRVYAVAEERLRLEKKDTDLRNRIAAFLRLVPKLYYTPKDFYERYIALFEPVERPELNPLSENNGQKSAFTKNDVQITNTHLITAASNKAFLWTAPNIKKLLSVDIHDASFVGREEKGHSKVPKGEDPEAEQWYSAAVHRYLRWALMGGKSGPAVADSMVLLGREETERRLGEAAMILGIPEMILGVSES